MLRVLPKLLLAGTFFLACGGRLSAAAPGSLDEAARASADIKSDQIKAGQLATFTPKVEMRVIETKLLVNGEVRTFIHYLPYAVDRASSSKKQSYEASAQKTAAAMYGMNANASSSSKASEAASRPTGRKRRKTALHRIIQETPAPVTDGRKPKYPPKE